MRHLVGGLLCGLLWIGAPDVAVIPAEALFFTGFGQSGPYQFLSPTGTNLGQPTIVPTRNTYGVSGAVTITPGGRIALVGGTLTGAAPEIFNTNFSLYANGDDVLAAFSGARDANGNFYAMKYDPGTIYRYDESGAITGSWVVGVGVSPFATCVAVNPAGTRAYYTRNNSADADDRYRVYEWNLSTSTLVGIFAQEVAAGLFANDHNAVITLSNGDVVIAWTDALGTNVVKHYDAAGTLLYTYTLAGSSDSFNPILTNAVHSARFWVSYHDNAISTFSGTRVSNIQTVSGTVVDTFTPDEGSFEFGGPFTVLLVGTNVPVPPDPPAPSPGCAAQLPVLPGSGRAGCASRVS